MWWTIWCVRKMAEVLMTVDLPEALLRLGTSWVQLGQLPVISQVAVNTNVWTETGLSLEGRVGYRQLEAVLGRQRSYGMAVVAAHGRNKDCLTSIFHLLTSPRNVSVPRASDIFRMVSLNFTAMNVNLTATFQRYRKFMWAYLFHWFMECWLSMFRLQNNIVDARLIQWKITNVTNFWQPRSMSGRVRESSDYKWELQLGCSSPKNNPCACTSNETIFWSWKFELLSSSPWNAYLSGNPWRYRVTTIVTNTF